MVAMTEDVEFWTDIAVIVLRCTRLKPPGYHHTPRPQARHLCILRILPNIRPKHSYVDHESNLFHCLQFSVLLVLVSNTESLNYPAVASLLCASCETLENPVPSRRHVGLPVRRFVRAHFLSERIEWATCELPVMVPENRKRAACRRFCVLSVPVIYSAPPMQKIQNWRVQSANREKNYLLSNSRLCTIHSSSSCSHCFLRCHPPHLRCLSPNLLSQTGWPVPEFIFRTYVRLSGWNTVKLIRFEIFFLIPVF